MGLRIINGVQKRSVVDLSRLVHVTEATASSADGLAVNHEYQDLRDLTLEDLKDVLEYETEAFEELRLEDFSDSVVERIDEEWLESFLLPGIDFGVASTVVALSALGCVPITSCRGNTLNDGHRHAAPTVCFYAAENTLPLLLQHANSSGVWLANNMDMVELYTNDLRSMLAFAREVANDLSRRSGDA